MQPDHILKSVFLCLVALQESEPVHACLPLMLMRAAVDMADAMSV